MSTIGQLENHYIQNAFSTEPPRKIQRLDSDSPSPRFAIFHKTNQQNEPVPEPLPISPQMFKEIMSKATASFPDRISEHPMPSKGIGVLPFEEKFVLLNEKKLTANTLLLSADIHEELPVPKLIHFIWFGNELPSHFKQRVGLWAQKQSSFGYQTILWTDNLQPSKSFMSWCRANQINLIPALSVFSESDFVGTFRLFMKNMTSVMPNYGLTSDILRLVILKHLGGVYLDCDTERDRLTAYCDVDEDPFRNHTNRDASEENRGLVLKIVEDQGDPIVYNNDIIFSKSGHNFIDNLLASIVKQPTWDHLWKQPENTATLEAKPYQVGYTMCLTGPSLINKVFQSWIQKQPWSAFRLSYKGQDLSLSWIKEKGWFHPGDVHNVVSKTLLKLYSTLLLDFEWNPRTFDILKYDEAFQYLEFDQEMRLEFLRIVLQKHPSIGAIENVYVFSEKEYRLIKQMTGKGLEVPKAQIQDGIKEPCFENPLQKLVQSHFPENEMREMLRFLLSLLKPEDSKIKSTLFREIFTKRKYFLIEDVLQSKPDWKSTFLHCLKRFYLENSKSPFPSLGKPIPEVIFKNFSKETIDLLNSDMSYDLNPIHYSKNPSLAQTLVAYGLAPSYKTP